MSAKSYKVHVSQDAIDQLKQKLGNVTLPNEITGSGRSQGPPLDEISRLTLAWKAFDWRAAEERINELEQYTIPIDVSGFGTLDIHFVHQKSSSPDAVPLLFIHGWPGSFLEVSKIISPLTNPSSPSQPSFNVVAPSLPNFGFSSGTTRPGFGLAQYAEALHKLMLALNYDRYATQSGDWGYWIARAIGHTYPSHCLASHYNMVFAARPKLFKQPLLYLQSLLTPSTATDAAAAKRTAWFTQNSRAYNILQSTRPQTLGYALADSPVALLAWMVEKLHDWSDAYPWSDEEILTWVSVYWFSTAGPAAAQRIYYEVSNEVDPKYSYSAMLEYMHGVRIGLTHNPKELEIMPKLWGRTLGNVVFEAENDSGGHFYAHERPEWLVRDLREMFRHGLEGSES